MRVASPTTASAAAGELLGHPRGLFLLFTTEMWERMSFYGMRALLVLYLTDATRGGFGWEKGDALSLYGWYTGLVYVTPLLGGWLADRVLGQRRAVVIGGVLMMIGHFLMAVPDLPPSLLFGVPRAVPLYLALGFIMAGNGLFKPNISVLVGQLYAPGDGRRDSGFTLFYMGINLGALLGALICGTLGERVGWGYGFAAAGVGMALGLGLFLWQAGPLLGGIGLRATEADRRQIAAARAAADGEPDGLTGIELQRIAVILILSFFVIFFWAAFEQAGGLMTLYTDEKVERHVGSFLIPTTWFNMVNSGLIILMGPLFSALWTGLARRRLDPPVPLKMALGLVLMSLGFVFMIGASQQADAEGKAALGWVVAAYAFHTMGELCLSPVGLSVVTKLAPARLVSLLMGIWFLSTAIANKLAGVVGSQAESAGEFAVFLGIVIATGAAGLVLAALSPVLVRMMHGADQKGVGAPGPDAAVVPGGPA
jgi:POT family proton-dependent oligopeptide transporter